MRIKSKYKIARRLGASVFEKTQTPKFALRAEQKKGDKFKRAQSGYGKQLLEKQRVRYTYNLSEKQFSNYVKEAITKGDTNSVANLYTLLERRLDNVVLRAGFAPTRFAARQYTSHGHFTVNGQRVTIPSYRVKIGDVVAVREGSRNKIIFEKLADSISENTTPSWITVKKTSNEISINNDPVYNPKELAFKLDQVVQFYKR